MGLSTSIVTCTDELEVTPKLCLPLNTLFFAVWLYKFLLRNLVPLQLSLSQFYWFTQSFLPLKKTATGDSNLRKIFFLRQQLFQKLKKNPNCSSIQQHKRKKSFKQSSVLLCRQTIVDL